MKLISFWCRTLKVLLSYAYVCTSIDLFKRNFWCSILQHEKCTVWRCHLLFFLLRRRVIELSAPLVLYFTEPYKYHDVLVPIHLEIWSLNLSLSLYLSRYPCAITRSPTTSNYKIYKFYRLYFLTRYYSFLVDVNHEAVLSTFFIDKIATNIQDFNSFSNKIRKRLMGDRNCINNILVLR